MILMQPEFRIIVPYESHLTIILMLHLHTSLKAASWGNWVSGKSHSNKVKVFSCLYSCSPSMTPSNTQPCPPSLSRFCTFVEKQEGWRRQFIRPANHFISSGAHLKVSKVMILLGQRAGGDHHSRWLHRSQDYCFFKFLAGWTHSGF